MKIFQEQMKAVLLFTGTDGGDDMWCAECIDQLLQAIKQQTSAIATLEKAEEAQRRKKHKGGRSTKLEEGAMRRPPKFRPRLLEPNLGALLPRTEEGSTRRPPKSYIHEFLNQILEVAAEERMRPIPKSKAPGHSPQW
jgi:hypothetical protein